jgi:type IV pilus assembly protein PilB
LEDIGFSKENQQIMSDAANKPFGMIIVTGPTGSGKSTTLYSLLKILNEEGVNITTIEDPVEYKMK